MRFLLVLFFCSVQVQSESTVPPKLPVLWDELRGLRDLVLSLRTEEVGRRQAMRSVESRLRDGELEADEQRRNLEELKEELEEMRRKEEDQRKMEDQRRLNSAEHQIHQLQTETTDQTSKLLNLQRKLNTTESQQDEVNTDDLKVAFSAGLTDSGSVGPFDEERTLIFSKTMTNIGQAYNQTAGVFMAPVRGVYFFSFTAADYLKGYMGLYLYWNDQPIMRATGPLSLPASYRLYDDNRNFSLFSGFLLFQL
uniref:C1q domain-containing protein n=1 Tax=Amphiprion percula TaxID=161767 RepID=A0A3P8RQ17_AMPPE